MKASIVIPVWNGLPYLPACLEALQAQGDSDFEVIAVDNASSDGSADLIAQQYPQVRLIRHLINRGFAGACNSGLRAAEGELLVLLNQDTQVQQGWLEALRERLADPQVGVVGCKIRYPDGRIQHAGGWIEWPLGLAHHFGQGEPDDGQWDIARMVEYVTGAAVAFRRDVVERIGLLDEGFRPAYFEDTDFCFRAREAGYEVWYEPKAVLLHHETTSLKDPAEISRIYQRGRLRFLLKHLPPERFLAEFVPAEMAYQPEALKGEGLALPLAYLEAIVMAPRSLQQRWGAEREIIRDVLIALQALYRQAQQEKWRGTFAGSLPLLNGGGLPALQEFEFRSDVPLIGPLIARFRTLWYSVAARWAVRFLIRQQNDINNYLYKALNDVALNEINLAEGLLMLASRIAEADLQTEHLPMEGG